MPAIWIDKTLKVPQYTYQYKVSSIWFNSQLQQAVSYKPSLSVKQAYYIPAQNQVLVTVRYLAFPEETGYTTEDPISLTVKVKYNAKFILHKKQRHYASAFIFSIKQTACYAQQ